MSEDALYRQKFNVEQWPTSKVTLYPTRASVVRQIEGVQLKPGLNEITISDLTSLADPDSIRVAGITDNHPARINDLTIDLVPNLFSSLYNDSDYDVESEYDSDEERPQALQTAEKRLLEIRRAIRDVTERKSAAEKEITLLEDYANSTARTTPDKNSPSTMKETLELYASQRRFQYEVIETCAQTLTELGKECVKAEKFLQNEKKKWQRVSHDKVQARKKRQAEKEERRRERKEQKPLKQDNVYRVRITIEVPHAPTSEDLKSKTSHKEQTERTELAESANAPQAASSDIQDATLVLTYTTAFASWTPHYDLRLDTTNPARSTLTYRAHFTNRTLETWHNAQITLSTSQASFGGLNEKIPRMESWRVALAKSWNHDVQNSGANGLFSLAEQKMKEEEQKVLYEHANLVNNRQLVKQSVNSQFQPQSHYQAQLKGGVSMGRATKSKSKGPRILASFGGSGSAPGAVSAPLTWADAAAEHSDRTESFKEAVDEVAATEVDVDGLTLAVGGNVIAHAAAGADTYGFTTTYELPTSRTVPSTELVRRHVIAEIPLPSLGFTHIIIPKLKAAAFLKARVTNTSAIPLLPGQAGLTLDGSFLGSLSFPRCSPDETTVLELGVDQSVKVEYDRPTVSRGSQGMIIVGKEEVGVFKRTMRITNTKSASVSLVVLDQIPVPEDEKIKVTILSPKGLKNVDDVVRNGVGVDGKAPTIKAKKPKPAEHAPSPSMSAKLEAVPETAASTLRQSFRRFPSISKRESSAALSALSNGTPPPPVPPTPIPSTSNNSSNSWGTAKAVLRKKGEVRFDVDLLKGGCVSIDLEWECRVPSGDGVAALS